MTFRELQKKSDAAFPALLLDILLPHQTRVNIRKVLFYVMFVFFIFSATNLLPEILTDIYVVEILTQYIYQFRGAFFMVFVIWIILHLYEFMYFSYYFKKTDIDFEVAKIIATTNTGDVTLGFIDSRLGRNVMKRLGITEPMTDRFLNTRENLVTSDEYEIIHTKTENQITIAEYGRTLIHFDSEFATFLRKHGITGKMFIDTLRWVSRINKDVRRKETWWSIENLSRIPTLGKNWSFGRIYLLEKYGHSIFSESSYIDLGSSWRLYMDYVEKMESVLVKNSGANIMLVVDETSAGLDIVSSLGKMILSGMISPILENKRMFVLDPQIILEETESRIEFESTFRDILIQSANAGNIILVIPHFDAFLENAHGMSVNVSAIISDSLRSSNLQIIALTSHAGYSSTVEPHRDIMSEFSTLNIEDMDTDKVITLLEDEVIRIEKLYSVFVTHPSIREIIRGARRFYPNDLLSNKAIDLLEQIIPDAKKYGYSIITRDYVIHFFHKMTGLADGIITEDEKAKYLHIEDSLRQRVIGQDRAIDILANSLRRSRAGLNNPNRPIGSFLFLGPTGVGKTETVKTLTEAMFGDEEDSIRLDMSEFRGPDAIKRLIGSKSDAGILTTKVHEKPYGVLLLDEFEKASNDVHNLFLQILDEGFFTNGKSERVYLRNMVIVATSNAGSVDIFSAMKGKDYLPLDIKDRLVSKLISENDFKPELINRFDDVVIFSPLKDEQLQEIAKLMIKKLNKRLTNKGIDIKANDDLINYLVETGSDTQFGARAMNRAIQDSVERLIADGIIGGHVSNGDTIEFEIADGDLSIKGV